MPAKKTDEEKKETKRKTQKKYYEKNKDKIIKYNKKYYKKNKEQIKEYQQTEKFKEIKKKSRDKAKKKIDCACGSSVSIHHFARHKTTNKHLKFCGEI